MPSLQNAHALVVGIANYSYVTHLPPSVLTDARDVYEVLVDAEACAYPKENVNLLLDGNATTGAMRQAFRELAERTDEDSIVTIFLSSHGGRIKNGPHAGEYIAPADARFDPNDPSALAATGISGAEFSAALRIIPARKVLVILDCCHAGGIGEPKSALVAPSSNVLVKGFSDEMYERLREGHGRVILASARPDEQSYILSGERNSLFTKHLLDGLRGGAAGEDEFVRVFRLYEYVQPKVTAQHAAQHPRFKCNLEENFPISFYKGGQKRIAPPTAVNDDEFAYDVYISYTDKEPDSKWVWDTFIPQLEKEGFDPKRIAVAGEVERPGVTLLLEAEQALKHSKRVLLALSNQYFDDPRATFDFDLTQHLQVKKQEFRLLPVIFASGIDESRIPDRMDIYTRIDLSKRTESRLQRLVEGLKSPLPTR